MQSNRYTNAQTALAVICDNDGGEDSERSVVSVNGIIPYHQPRGKRQLRYHTGLSRPEVASDPNQRANLCDSASHRVLEVTPNMAGWDV